MMSLPEQATEQLNDLNQQLDSEMTQFMETLQYQPDVRLVDERIVLSPLEAQEQSNRLKKLKSQISRCLPKIDLTDLLIEVDLLTGFSDHLVHTGGHQIRSQETKRYLYATLLSQACNLGPKAMAKGADLSYERLLWQGTNLSRETLSHIDLTPIPAKSKLIDIRAFFSLQVTFLNVPPYAGSPVA